ncbi:MFS transporter [Streptomyces sp. GbtcB7]|uniref:MFS transporter n=1 Tax=Streptomyces sp. GbtcB7 TaxID=2824752 RepID=UPI001C3029ED|nr:MFS transporter [Streptomyces sp. GbtcB7]
MASSTTHRAWLVVGGSTVALLASTGPLLLSTSGLFVKPIGDEFGWNRSTISGAVGLAGLVIALTLPFVGRLLDRWGVRRVMVPTVCCFAASLALLAVTPPSVPVFMALFALVGLTGAGQGPLPYVRVISGWLDTRRGIGIGVALIGVGLGTALVPLYAQALIGSLGWRGAYVGLGVLLLVVALPPLLLVIREPSPEERQNLGGSVEAGQHSDPGQETAPRLSGLDRGQALRSRHFWILAPVTLIAAAAINGSMAHFVPILTDRGMSDAEAAAMLVPAGLVSVVGRPLSGYLLDRFFGPHVAAVVLLLPCVGYALLSSSAPPVLGMIALGLAIGAEVDLISYMTSRYFGLKSFGQLYGYMYGIFAIGSAMGPLLFAASFDSLGSYNPAFWAFGAALVLASAACLLLGPYTYPPGPEQDSLPPRSATSASASAAGSA